MWKKVLNCLKWAGVAAITVPAIVVAGYIGWTIKDWLILNLWWPDHLPFARMVECSGTPEGKREIECGYLYADLEDDQPDKGFVRLPYQILRSASPDRRQEPVVLVNGGPGMMSAADPTYANFVGPEFDEPAFAWIEKHDLINYSQRGLPDTKPSLACDAFQSDVPSYWNYWSQAVLGAKIVYTTLRDLIGRNGYPYTFISLEEYLGLLEDCFSQLSGKGIEIEYFSTDYSAKDLHSLIVALDLQDPIVWGASYGSRVALTLLKDHPEDVHVAILEGVDPPGLTEAFDENAYFFDRLAEINRICDRSGACPEGTERPLHRSVLNARRFRKDPISARFRSFLAEPMDAEVDHLLYVMALAYGFYTIEDIARLPRVMAGESGQISRMISNIEESDQTISWSLNAAVACNDVDWSRQPSNETNLPAEHPFRDFLSVTRTAAVQGCDIVRGNGNPPPKPIKPVSTSVPVLMLNGELDVATPAPLMWQQLEHLPNGWAFEFKGLGHSVSDSACAQKIIRNFLNNPRSNPHDDCFDKLTEPLFW